MVLKSVVTPPHRTIWNIEQLIIPKIRYDLFNKLDDEIFIKIRGNNMIKTIVFYAIEK